MSDVSIRREARAGRITLTRPKALNALDAGMVRAIAPAFERFMADPEISVVVIDAEGPRAFCAGGDLRELFDLAQAGRTDTANGFWAQEYRLNRRIAQSPKPVVALMQGLVMGGGVGLGCHARHRIVGETTRIALPECAIGLVPDVGSTDLLARAPGQMGEFLGLTGYRMGPGDAIGLGFADRYVLEADWPELIARLARAGDPGGIIDAVARIAPAPAFDAFAKEVDAAFGASDLVGLIGLLETSDWGRGVRDLLSGRSPLSMDCTLRLVRAARAGPGVAEALRREHRFTRRSIEAGELLEGIRAAVIDKDQRPKWRHAPNAVPEEAVAAMLAPLGDDELTFAEAPDGPRERANGG